MNLQQVCLMLCVLPALTSSVFAAAEFPVDPSGDPQTQPDIDGAVVVWAEYVSAYGDYDIVGIDLQSPAGFIYINDWANDQRHPRIFGSHVAFQDDFYGDNSDHDIYLADIANPANVLLYAVAVTEDVTETNPALSGDTVVWQTNTGTPASPDWNIRAADMADPNAPFVYVVDDFPSNQTAPGVFRSRVVYQDDTDGHQDIWTADVWQKTAPAYAAVIADDNAAALHQTVPAVWGETVVFTQQNPAGDGDILAVDRTDPRNPVQWTIAAGPADQTHPDIDAHLIVWQDNRHGHWDIYGYNRVTQKEFRITDDPADQTSPAVSGDTVVWQDTRDGVETIYAVYLDPVDSAVCDIPLPGDADGNCQITLADFTALAENWLACNLTPTDACDK